MKALPRTMYTTGLLYSPVSRYPMQTATLDPPALPVSHLALRGWVAGNMVPGQCPADSKIIVRTDSPDSRFKLDISPDILLFVY